MDHRLVLMPGLDGTGDLFAPLQAALPPGLRTRIVRYPREEALGYAALVERVVAELDGDEPLVLVGESFSGPVALNVAHRLGARVRAVVLLASFVENPTPMPAFAGARIPTAAFRMAPPAAFLRRFLTGNDAPQALVDQLAAVIASVAPEVFATRVRALVGLRKEDVAVSPELPVLVVHGVKDRLVAPGAAATILARFPRAQLVELDAPHFLAQRQPAALWAAMERFLGTIEA